MLSRNLTDFVKFLACIMIVLHHYSQIMIISGAGNIIYQAFSTQGGWLGVAIFFFLSGYGIMKSDLSNPLSISSFIQKRLIKIYLPAVLVTFCWIVFRKIYFSDYIEYDIFKLLNILLWDFDDVVLWFVRSIIILYIFFSFYAFILRSLKQHDYYNQINIILLLIVTPLCIWLTKTGFVHSLSVGLFFVGILLAQIDNCNKNTAFFLKITCVIVYSVFCAYILNYSVVTRADWIHIIFNVAFIISSIIICSFKEFKVPKLPKWINSSTYDIYLVHNKAIILLRPCYTVVPLYIFVLLTLFFTIISYYLRKITKV